MFLPKYEYVDVYKYRRAARDSSGQEDAGVSRIENYGDVMQMGLFSFCLLPPSFILILSGRRI